MNNMTVINGRKRLHGELKVQGAKNSVLPILAAAVIVALALLFIAGYNIYQKISYREFNKVSEKEFKIPVFFLLA